jgi:PAS domain-containing protein
MLRSCWILNNTCVYNMIKTYPYIINTWWGHPEKFRVDAHGIYAKASLDTHMIYVVLMLCRIFGKKVPTHVLVEWVRFMHEVDEGYSFNWAKMLSDNLAKEITEYQQDKSKGQSPLSTCSHISWTLFAF